MKPMLKQFALTMALAALGLGTAHAAAPFGKQVTAAIELQGGSESNLKWKAPLTATYKIHVFVPKNGTATNALYRVYPKGKRTGSTQCLSSDAKYPCYEASIDQTQYQNTWTQLMVDSDPDTQWEFVKGRGYVTAVASNLGAAELLNLSALVRFENQAIQIGKTYQGGIIFHIDNTGDHGLVAAPKDQSSGIQWYNGSYMDTGATATAVGTGAANTTKIVKAQGAGAYAAWLAANLVLNGYDDWFLPSDHELFLMDKKIGPGAAAPLRNIGRFASSYYWSSSENSTSFARERNFGRGYHSNTFRKDDTLYVRAVRAF